MGGVVGWNEPGIWGLVDERVGGERVERPRRAQQLLKGNQR